MNKPENNHNSNNLSDGNNNLESSISSNNDLSNSSSIEIIPIPSLNIEQTDINLQMDAAKSHNTDKSSATDNNILMKKWYGLLPQNNAKISSFNRKPNHSAKYDVYAKTKGKSSPEGILKLMDIINSSHNPIAENDSHDKNK